MKTSTAFAITMTIGAIVLSLPASAADFSFQGAHLGMTLSRFEKLGEVACTPSADREESNVGVMICERADDRPQNFSAGGVYTFYSGILFLITIDGPAHAFDWTLGELEKDYKKASVVGVDAIESAGGNASRALMAIDAVGDSSLIRNAHLWRHKDQTLIIASGRRHYADRKDEDFVSVQYAKWSTVDDLLAAIEAGQRPPRDPF